MREESVARRYAAAFLAVSEKAGDAVAARDNIRVIADTIAGNAMLSAVLNQPQVTIAVKKRALAASFAGVATPATFAFLDLLTDKRRISLVGDIATEVERLVRLQQNVAVATAVTAQPLHTAQVAALKSSLEKRTGKTIELTTEVDPSLIGGVLVRIGDTVMDGSVRGKLDRLHEQLLARK